MTAEPAWADRATLLGGDQSPRDIRRAADSGALHRFRPGRYANGPAWDQASDEVRHRLRSMELGMWLAGRAVISHQSAALVHGLQLPRVDLSKVHATWPGAPGRGVTSNIHPHRSRLRPEDLTVVEGIAVTSVARTVFDVARTLHWAGGIAIADSALHLGLCSVDELMDVLDSARRTPGAFRATRVIEFADGRAESVGESLCRLRFAQIGLPAPRLQSVIPLAAGKSARVDFDFDEYDTVGEFDGLIKYGRLLEPGQDPGEVVTTEKIREDRVRDTGRQFTRFIWRDFGYLQAMFARAAQAFVRAGHPNWKREPPRFMTNPPGK